MLINYQQKQKKKKELLSHQEVLPHSATGCLSHQEAALRDAVSWCDRHQVRGLSRVRCGQTSSLLGHRSWRAQQAHPAR